MKNEKPSIFQREDAPLNVTFLVLSGASIMCVASAIDPLRAANRIAGAPLYSWTVQSPDGTQPMTTSGLPVAVSRKFDANARHELLVVIAGFGTAPYARGPFIAGLAKAGRRARAIGGIEAGTWLLGHAGLLDGRGATTHFEDLEDFRAAFPAADVRPERFVIDGPAFTCGGASPAFDLMLHLIRCRQGAALAMNVASVFLYEQSRASTDAQPLVSVGELDRKAPSVAAAIRLMEANIDTPLTVAAIAKRIGVAQRTLELAFEKHLGQAPGHYCLSLRLAAARKMVTDTALPMTEIANRAGFSGGAAFARAFKARFGKPATSLR